MKIIDYQNRGGYTVSAKIEFREIIWQSQDYQEELALRQDILRRPLGLDLFQENLADEKFDTHIGAFSGEKLVGTLMIKAAVNHCVQLRQAAVLEPYRGNGVGAGMICFAERLCRSQGIRHIWLNARQTAENFYLRLGYHNVGEPFLELGIPHIRMEKVFIEKEADCD